MIAATRTMAGDPVRGSFVRHLIDDVLGMSEGKSRSGAFRWWYDDLAKAVVRVKPLGNYPDAAAEKIKQGVSFVAAARPAYTTLAYLRKCAGIPSKPLVDAILAANKEKSEASLAELRLAQKSDERSLLQAVVREGREAIEAQAAVVEAAENLLLDPAL